jgi:hypothetical protein
MRVKTCIVLFACALSACSKPVAPDWQRVTQATPCIAATPPAALPSAEGTPAVEVVAPAACDAPEFYLDVANISVKGGTPYVILQTRYADGRVGSIRAEANCPLKKLEPTALKEAIYDKGGALVLDHMTTMSAEDEAAVLARACAQR